MKRRLAASFLFILVLSLTSPAQSSIETEDYSIDDYELTVETQPGVTSVQVTMDITYRILSGTKSTGFKYVGNYEVEELSGRDDDGAIETSVEQQRETRINWSFTPSGPGTKRIVVIFTIRNAITNGGQESNKFEAGWAGVFKVPVRSAHYRFVFPDNAERTVISTPAAYTASERNGLRTIEINQTPLSIPTFEMIFSPRIVDAEWSFVSIVGISSIVIAALGIASIPVILIVRKARRAGWRSSTSSSGSGSSCAGGSSCSGGSCGGGCGGGCGG